MAPSHLDLVFNSNIFNIESDNPHGKNDHSVIQFCVTWGQTMRATTKRIYRRVDINNVLNFANTFELTPHDINDPLALWRVIKIYIIVIDSSYVPAKTINVSPRPALFKWHEGHFSAKEPSNETQFVFLCLTITLLTFRPEIEQYFLTNHGMADFERSIARHVKSNNDNNNNNNNNKRLFTYARSHTNAHAIVNDTQRGQHLHYVLRRVSKLLRGIFGFCL